MSEADNTQTNYMEDIAQVIRVERLVDERERVIARKTTIRRIKKIT